jgi:hypothetical protein
MTPGTRVTAQALPSRINGPFWTFRTGADATRNAVIIDAGSDDRINTGIQIFYTYAATYDAVHDKLYLAHP